MGLLKKIKNRIKLALMIDVSGRALFPKTDSIIISPDFSTGRFININICSSNVRVKIAENVLMRQFCSIYIDTQAELIINKNVFFNNYCSINCLKKIVIGENTLFGEGVKIYDHNHLYKTSPTVSAERNEFKKNEVIIGKNCWIGSNVTILQGVVIGDNVIIGANTLIYKSVKSNSIVKSKVEQIVEVY